MAFGKQAEPFVLALQCPPGEVDKKNFCTAKL